VRSAATPLVLLVAGLAGPACAEARASSSPAAFPAPADSPTVVLLHGLGRTGASMRPMQEALEGAGYRVVNLGYPSRRHPIGALTDSVHAALRGCCADAGPLHFVTHSLGGILVRAYAEDHGAGGIGRVVMLSPPNRGSEVVDRLDDLPVFEWILGPAALQLGTDAAGVAVGLGPPPFDVGIIMGDASLNPLFSWWLPGPDDGAVSVESARLDGADDFLVVPYTHTFIMRREDVITQVLAFLHDGRFQEPGERAR
jgi:triacylglycerol lipase